MISSSCPALSDLGSSLISLTSTSPPRDHHLPTLQRHSSLCPPSQAEDHPKVESVRIRNMVIHWCTICLWIIFDSVVILPRFFALLRFVLFVLPRLQDLSHTPTSSHRPRSHPCHPTLLTLHQNLPVPLNPHIHPPSQNHLQGHPPVCYRESVSLMHVSIFLFLVILLFISLKPSTGFFLFVANILLGLSRTFTFTFTIIDPSFHYPFVSFLLSFNQRFGVRERNGGIGRGDDKAFKCLLHENMKNPASKGVTIKLILVGCLSFWVIMSCNLWVT